ncbi:MAG: hypothetical protein WDN72_03245 [Alphaproteobacteria bacterium]
MGNQVTLTNTRAGGTGSATVHCVGEILIGYGPTWASGQGESTCSFTCH